MVGQSRDLFLRLFFFTSHDDHTDYWQKSYFHSPRLLVEVALNSSRTPEVHNITKSLFLSILNTMTGEFRIAKGWRIFIYICSPLLIGLFVFIGFIAFNSETSNLTVLLILVPVSVGGNILFIYGLIETIKGRFIIGVKSISNLSAFGTRTLYFEEVKGFRADSNYIYIISNSKNKKSIKVSTYIEQSDRILNWLNNKFLELDSFEAMEEEKQILTDNEFGINQQAREYRLNEARRAAKGINIIGVGVCCWLWFYPKPYLISVVVAMIVPVIAFGLVFIYQGLIRFDEKKNSAYPSIIYGFGATSAALMIRALFDYEILEYKNLWIIVSTVTIPLVCLLLFSTKELKFSKWVDYVTALTITGIVLCYTFGTYVVTNCMFDKTEPAVFSSEVTDKEITSGKSTTYYLTLKPWGPRTETERVSVTKDQYEGIEKGDTVAIYLGQGLLKTPWFYLETE
jgi:hypothetical protein